MIGRGVNTLSELSQGNLGAVMNLDEFKEGIDKEVKKNNTAPNLDTLENKLSSE